MRSSQNSSTSFAHRIISQSSRGVILIESVNIAWGWIFLFDMVVFIKYAKVVCPKLRFLRRSRKMVHVGKTSFFKENTFLRIFHVESLREAFFDFFLSNERTTPLPPHMPKRDRAHKLSNELHSSLSTSGSTSDRARRVLSAESNKRLKTVHGNRSIDRLKVGQ